MEKWRFKKLIKIPIFVLLLMLIIILISRLGLKEIENLKLIKIIMGINGLFAIGIILVYAITNIFKGKSELNINSYYSQLDFNCSPAMASFVIDNSLEKAEDIFATVLDLSARKYLNIERVNSKLEITPTEKVWKGLYEHEKYVLSTINYNRKIETEWFRTLVIRDCKHEKLIKENTNPIIKFFIFLRNKMYYVGIGLLLLVFVILSGGSGEAEIYGYSAMPKEMLNFLIIVFVVGLILLLISYIGNFTVVENKKTSKGELSFIKIRGLKNYIRDYTLLEEKDYDYLTLTDRYLPFALALGEGEKLEQLHIDTEEFKKIMNL